MLLDILHLEDEESGAPNVNSGELRNGSSLHEGFYDLILFFQYLPLF